MIIPNFILNHPHKRQVIIWWDDDDDGGSSSVSDGSSGSSIIQTPGSYTFTSVEKQAKKLLDKIFDDVDASSVEKTHLALAITFAIYNLFPLVPVLYVLGKRLRRWLAQRLVHSVHVTHAQISAKAVPEVTKSVSTWLPALFFSTQLCWVVYYVTEAVIAAGKGEIVITFEDYRFTTAQRYA
jgi:hypothetical protein